MALDTVEVENSPARGFGVLRELLRAMRPKDWIKNVFVFAAITAMYLFRLAFSATRWLLPYVEFATAPEPLHRRLRVVFAAVIVGAIASLAAAAIWTLFQ